MKYLLVFLSFFCLLGNISAACRSVETVAITSEPSLDGKLDEPCWQSGDWQKNFSMCSDGSAAGEATSFKVLNSPRGLWIGIKAQDRKLISSMRKLDDPVWHDDSVEIMIAPVAQFASDKNVREAAHFIINAHGCKYDAYNIGGIDSAAWTPSWYTAAQRTKDGFTLEIFLPFTLFSDHGISSGDWQFNIYRTHKGGKITLVSSWNRAQKVSDSDNYGVIRNVKCDKDRFTVNAEKLSFRKEIKGSATSTVLDTVFKGRKNTRYTVTAAIYAPNGAFANLANTESVSNDQGVIKAVIPANFDASGNCRVRLTIADEQGKVFDDTRIVKANLAPLSVAVQHPIYRNILFSSDPDRNIRCAIKITLPPEKRKNTLLTLKMIDAGGKVLDEKNIRDLPEVYEYKFNASNAPEGNLTLQCSTGGAKLTHDFIIAPKVMKGSEVYIGQSGNLLVNGKEFFIHGFMGAYKDFDDMQNATCNTVHFYTLNRRDIPEITARLDECHRRGLRVLFSPFYKMSVGFYGVNRNGKAYAKLTPAEWENMRKLVLVVKDHPALLGWKIFDEPRGSEWHAELQQIYKFLCKIDPAHPVFGVDNGADSCINLQSACDVISLDMYLNPNERGEPLRSVESILSSVERIARNLQPGKLLLYTPQAFDVDSFMPKDSPRKHLPPSMEESSATVFGALAAGARGIMAYKIGNKALVKPGERHSNAGIYADESLRKAYLEVIMPALSREAEFFLRPGTFVPSKNGIRTLEKVMPDGSKRVMNVSEKRPHTIEFKNNK